ncbi:hypothetical protein GQX74_006604 [Glossina fuscipes]|nr:hypothetical protein GQX74_006604 [Glossina fuscipes]
MKTQIFLKKSNKASGKPAGELKYFQTILHLWEDKVLILFQLFIANDYNKCLKSRWVGEPNTAAGGTKGEKADFKGNGGEGGTCGGEFVAATAEAMACETSSPDNITSIVCKTSPR